MANKGQNNSNNNLTPSSASSQTSTSGATITSSTMTKSISNALKAAGRQTSKQNNFGSGHIKGRQKTWSVDDATLSVFRKWSEDLPSRGLRPLVIVNSSKGMRCNSDLSILYPLVLTGVLDECDYPGFTITRLSFDPAAENKEDLYLNVLDYLQDDTYELIWDQTGTLEGCAKLPTDAFEIRTENDRLLEVLPNFDFSNINPEDAEYIGMLALKDMRRHYLQSIGCIDTAFNSNNDYECVKEAMNAFGNGYIGFPLSESEFDSLLDGSIINTDEAAANHLMEYIPDSIIDKSNIEYWKKIIRDTRNMMGMWQYALESAGMPVNILGYRLNETEIYNRHIDANITRKLGELVGVYDMLDNYFIHGVSFEDIVA